MRVVVQRVAEASVAVNEEISGKIKKGLLIFIGIENADTDDDIRWLSNKITNMRIFNDVNAVMNKSIKDVNGEILLVSQFTLQASIAKGNRPSYSKASKAEVAIPMYEKMIQQLSAELGKPIATGVFGADMKVHLLNDGPVTIIVDSKNKA